MKFEAWKRWQRGKGEEKLGFDEMASEMWSSVGRLKAAWFTVVVCSEALFSPQEKANVQALYIKISRQNSGIEGSWISQRLAHRKSIYLSQTPGTLPVLTLERPLQDAPELHCSLRKLNTLVGEAGSIVYCCNLSKAHFFSSLSYTNFTELVQINMLILK